MTRAIGPDPHRETYIAPTGGKRPDLFPRRKVPSVTRALIVILAGVSAVVLGVAATAVAQVMGA